MKWAALDRTRWNRWFAWHPVKVGGQWVWLETIERRCGETFCGDYQEYRYE